MAHYVTTMLIRRRADETFAFVSDLRNAPKWDPQTVEAAKVSEGPITAGTRFCLVGNLLGYNFKLPYEIQLYDPPCELVIAGETAVLRYRDRITLAPQGAETYLTYEAQLEAKGVLRFANPLLPLLFQQIGDAATKQMPEAVENLA
jgi:hypothetical protein